MTGRHRKQSTTSLSAAKVAAAGAMLGGAGLALAAPAANAAPDSQWDQVAACESGGNWAINTGNGYHGGLQFSPSTWASYGGTQYAPTANQASRAQQIAIAEKVLAGQGKGAWPSCGTGLGSATPRTVSPTDTGTTKPVTKPVSKPAAKPAAKPVAKPVAKPAAKPVAKPVAKPAAKPAAQAGQSVNSQYINQVISQAQSGGQQVDPAVLAMLQQAAAKGY
ncbi:transglycosylase family protein [Tsukamurella tyrosinosolvens]|uniref:Transglycosylase-like domain-containing protein n=1 Tax=Tsukamurella tyrosinosolvens TaxID=57704 RepID=A0A1H4NA55_TSUTY|nr:transglycosylase family protein [Tsukamurella tyrosinosolvens]KXO97072.1 transglycosylase [Tsukamurella tyrosinosolvens]KXP02598.1 transglycosylase [Tsukamurella tyrosinosolvens]KZL96736.1 transglycosylase [Tsukamurella tyrosinosolvens]MCA4996649.1 transglycosylase family protein [Tsukamurella tyrosinosolvens]QRY86105.1 transglycosylase family protein [Tsukamurella tyrosinosolvens]